MSAPDRLAAAATLFHAGQYARALAALGDPAHAAGIDALNLAAACARALGDPTRAAQWLRQAVGRDAGHAPSWNNLGILLQQQGDASGAEAAYRRAIALLPAYADAHYNLGLVLQQGGLWDAAAAAHGQALALQGAHAGANANRAIVLERLGRLDEAERHYAAAAALTPADPALRQRHADLLQALGRPDDALAAYRAALALAPDHPELLNNLGVLHARCGRADAAEDTYRRLLARHPQHADAWHNLGLLLTGQRRFDAAVAALQTYAGLRPDDAEGWNSLGNACQLQGRHQQAEAAYRRALALRPGAAKTINNLAALLQRSGQAGAAEAAYRAAIDADPAYPEARWNLGFLLLSQGRLEEGWPWMEARHDPALARPIAARPPLACPQWQGESLAGRRIVVWPEQGFGDMIQFVRYLPLLKAAGADRVTLVCPDPLVPLLRSAAGADLVLAASALARLAPQDCWVLMLSLPMHFHTTVDTIPAPQPYLHAEPARIDHWRARLAQAAPAKLKVGLVWRGFGGHVNDAARSLPDSGALAPLLALPGISWFSLQRGMDGQGGTADSAPGVVDLGRDIADFGDTAAIVAQLDLVIAVDTAVVHVAGALGTPCWVLLPAVHPDWRWLSGRSDTPWYPGTMRLYRQRTPDDWKPAIAAMASDLQLLLLTS
jgi:tetratricopeptide (TPR) repeat protein